MRIAVLVLTLVTVHSFAAAAIPVPAESVPFHLTPRGGVIVRVMLDGSGPVPFLVDTGSSGTVISTSLAARLRLEPVAKAIASSAIGQTLRLVTRIEHLTVGAVRSRGVLATISPDEELASLDRAPGNVAIQGIIGQDVLATLRYTIDYERRRIIWSDSAAGIPSGAAVVTLEARDDRFLAILPQQGSTIRLVPDTGAEALVLFRGDGRTTPSVTWSGRRAVVSGIAGSTEARLGRVATLQIGAATLNDVPAVIVERSRPASAADGLLPLHLFARVTFNGPERQLVIERK